MSLDAYARKYIIPTLITSLDLYLTEILIWLKVWLIIKWILAIFCFWNEACEEGLTIFNAKFLEEKLGCRM